MARKDGLQGRMDLEQRDNKLAELDSELLLKMMDGTFFLTFEFLEFCPQCLKYSSSLGLITSLVQESSFGF